MHVTAQFCSITRFGDEIAHYKLALHSKFVAPFLVWTPGYKSKAYLICQYTYGFRFCVLLPQMIYQLDRNLINSHSVNKPERHPALSEIAKFISLSIYTFGSYIPFSHEIKQFQTLCFQWKQMFLHNMKKRNKKDSAEIRTSSVLRALR